MLITSRANARIRAMRALDTQKARRETGLHLIEGEKLLMEAVRAGMRLDAVLVEQGCDIALPADAPVLTVTRPVLEAVCPSKTPQGVCASVFTPDQTPPASFPPGLIVVLERVQDPGNVGTILRTADAMGAAGLLASEDTADVFSSKALRAAMGSTYHIPVWRGDIMSALERMRRDGFALLCGHLAGGARLPELTARVALVIGNEGSGATDAVAAQCIPYRLPMFGRAESLNAAVAAGIMLYEIRRNMQCSSC